MNEQTTMLPPLTAVDPNLSTPLPPPPPPAGTAVPTFAPPGLATGPAVPLTPPAPHAAEPAHPPLAEPPAAPAPPAATPAAETAELIAASSQVPALASTTTPVIPQASTIAPAAPAQLSDQTPPVATPPQPVEPAPPVATPPQPVEPAPPVATPAQPVEPTPPTATAPLPAEPSNDTDAVAAEVTDKAATKAVTRAAKAEAVAAKKALKAEQAAAKKTTKAQRAGKKKTSTKATKPSKKPAARKNAPSKKGPIALLALLVVAALGAAWFFLVRDDGGSAAVTPEAVAPVVETYSLPQALENARNAQAMQFDVAAELDGVASTITAQVDRSSRLMSVTTSSSGLTSAASDLSLPDWINVIVDSAERVAYIDSNALAAINPRIDADWVRIELDDPVVASTLDVRPLTINPLDVADLLDDVDATDLGLETIDGERLQHYTVPVDAQLILMDAPAPTILLDVWVSTDNQIRRVAFGDGSGELTFEMTIIVFDRSFTIAAPQPSATTSLSEIIAG